MVRDYHTDFAIIGAGMTGCKLAFHLSQFASCILIEKSEPLKPYLNAKVMCKHSWKWYSELNIQDGENSNCKIPIHPHWKTIYASRETEAEIDGHEFQEPLGVVFNEYDLRKWYLDNARSDNLQIFWNQKCVDAHKQEIPGDAQNEGYKWLLSINSPDNKDRSVIRARCVILATGSTELKDPKSLHDVFGFEKPKQLHTISCSFSAPPNILDRNLPIQYMYRLHPQVSTKGMLFLNRCREFFTIGFVDDLPYSQMAAKFHRILRNYKPIQPYLSEVTPNPAQLKDDDFNYGTTSVGLVSPLIRDGVVVIGDAAGLLYSMYYEGTLGIGASTKILSEELQKIMQNGANFSRDRLESFEERLHQEIGKRYLLAGKMAKELFYEFGEHPPFSIWEVYLQNINDIVQVRKNIHHAYVTQDIRNYPLDNDFWVGEQLFHRLPSMKKMLLLPKFLQFKLKYSS